LLKSSRKLAFSHWPRDARWGAFGSSV
jgi:hypothetical protein